jgi:hypothetical protein
MILDERDERDLLHAVSIIRRILKAHGVIDKNIPATIKRCAEEITAHEAEKITEVRDDIPDATDSQADGFATE